MSVSAGAMLQHTGRIDSLRRIVVENDRARDMCEFVVCRPKISLTLMTIFF